MDAKAMIAGNSTLYGTLSIRTHLAPADLSAVSREEPTTTDAPLLLTKWSDRHDARVGDLVSISIKYSNQGGRPITDVVVADSLAARLGYVAGSAESSRNAVFTTEPNDAGSVVLRWQIGGTLLPGDSGVVRFKARVR